MGRQSIQSYPDEAQSTINGATSFTPAGTVSGTGAPVIPQPTLVDGKTFAPPGTGNLFTNPLDFVRGYFQSYNFTVERAFKGEWTAQVGYVGSHAVKIVGNYNINYGLPGGGAASQLLFKYGITATANKNLPAYSDKYNSLQATLRKRYSRGINLNLAFTYQHDIGILPPQTINIVIPQYFSRNNTTSAIDRTFNLYIGGGYELPFGKGSFPKNGTGSLGCRRLEGERTLFAYFWISVHCDLLDRLVQLSGPHYSDSQPNSSNRRSRWQGRRRNILFQSPGLCTGHNRKPWNLRVLPASWPGCNQPGSFALPGVPGNGTDPGAIPC